MTLPTSPVDRHLPKGPNFLGIVIGFGLAIIVVIALVWWFLAHHGNKVLQLNTHPTPSQTMLELPAATSPSITA